MKEEKKLSYNLVFVDGYFFLLNDDEIKEGDWCIHNGEIKKATLSVLGFANEFVKKIFAHLPHGDCKYLQGVHLLPSYCQSKNDVVVGFEFNGIINKDTTNGHTKIGGDWKFIDWIEYKKINQNNNKTD